jgi:hypothetical protein
MNEKNTATLNPVIDTVSEIHVMRKLNRYSLPVIADKITRITLGIPRTINTLTVIRIR